jgi:hypothetical protein
MLRVSKAARRSFEIIFVGKSRTSLEGEEKKPLPPQKKKLVFEGTIKVTQFSTIAGSD